MRFVTVEIKKLGEGHDAEGWVYSDLAPPYQSVQETISDCYDEISGYLETLGTMMPPLSELDLNQDGDESYVYWESGQMEGDELLASLERRLSSLTEMLIAVKSQRVG